MKYKVALWGPGAEDAGFNFSFYTLSEAILCVTLWTENASLKAYLWNGSDWIYYQNGQPQ